MKEGETRQREHRPGAEPVGQTAGGEVAEGHHPAARPPVQGQHPAADVIGGGDLEQGRRQRDEHRLCQTDGRRREQRTGPGDGVAEGHQRQPAEDARREEQIPAVDPSREAGKQEGADERTAADRHHEQAIGRAGRTEHIRRQPGQGRVVAHREGTMKEDERDQRGHDRGVEGGADTLPELRQRVVVRAAALVRYLAQHPDLPDGQGREHGRDEEGAGATADVEQRRGQ